MTQAIAGMSAKWQSALVQHGAGQSPDEDNLTLSLDIPKAANEPWCYVPKGVLGSVPQAFGVVGVMEVP